MLLWESKAGTPKIVPALWAALDVESAAEAIEYKFGLSYDTSADEFIGAPPAS